MKDLNSIGIIHIVDQGHLKDAINAPASFNASEFI